jgi:hypothetical protein
LVLLQFVDCWCCSSLLVVDAAYAIHLLII